MSSDPNDLETLTPGHFLIGQAITTIPEPDITSLNVNALRHYQIVQHISQTFWQQWSKEYLNQVQQRHKWQLPQPNMQKGQVVLIKDDNLPPSQWMLGRIIQTFPGSDHLIRAAEIKCKNNTITRPIHKLCLLPTIDNKQTNKN